MKRFKSKHAGFTLLEVMIAMSILALGATSILSIFVAAISFHTERVEGNRITELRNWARQHAQIVFNNFNPNDPEIVKKGQKPIPPKIVVDLTDLDAATTSTDPLVREAAEKFPGFKYEVLFEEDQFSVAGSSVVAHIRIYRMSGQLDDTQLVDKEFLTRTGVPYYEYFRDASWSGPMNDKRNAARDLDPRRR